ncbi:hypothetical protein K1T71_004987 [Dendrolimus kikuchii]|uniref:Uncharacterized protein n=1 Tax=Dendrolimus kikuchii TaxID=765133 RepID=A0ACC1D638_9NEOP|nr:hypothetical protein K1T71_004987 [Dendrolimus kikuchii]
MSSDDYQIQNVSRYTRKTYKKNRRGARENEQDYTSIEAEISPIVTGAVDTAGCSCDIDPDGEITNILHKKCPVISLAEQQLRRLLDETDKLMCDNTRCCRSMYEFLCFCKEIITQSKSRCALVVLIVIAFFTGLLFGTASCGTYLGRFNNPLLDCVDNYFIPETYPKIEDTYHSIV